MPGTFELRLSRLRLRLRLLASRSGVVRDFRIFNFKSVQGIDRPPMNLANKPAAKEPPTGGFKGGPATNQLSSSELLNLLRHPGSNVDAGGLHDGGTLSRHSTGKEGGEGTGISPLESEFSKLFLALGSHDAKTHRPSGTNDNFGMTGLADQVMGLSQGQKTTSLSYGIDVRLMGLRLDQQDQALSKSFISPWCDRRRGEVKLSPSSGATSPTAGEMLSFGLDGVLPACYNVQPSPPVTSKIANFTDETLFYMFYAMPGDRMQELAARELTSRTWRFHKELKVWIMPEDSSASAIQKQMISPDLGPDLPKSIGIKSPTFAREATAANPTGALQNYAVFDPQTWTKVIKELPIRADQLEDRFLGSTLQPQPGKPTPNLQPSNQRPVAAGSGKGSTFV